MQFTDRQIKNLKPKEKRFDLRESNGDGFGIRVFPTGIKSWIFFYFFEGRKRRMTLGNYPEVPLSEARQRHREALSLLNQQIDPGLAKKQSSDESRAAPTVTALANEYLDIWAKPRKRSAKEDERILKKDILPIWGNLKAKSITRRDVVLLLDKILDRGAPIAANRTLAVIRRMFNFGVERDILSISPCFSVKAPGKERQRDRMLSGDEIRRFWIGLESAPMSEFTKLALKFQLITAQRKGEIIGSEWSEFDLTTRCWSLPSEKIKNGNAHRVPLSSLALSVLDELKTLANGSPWLFPSPTGKSHMSGMAIDHAVRRSRECFPEVVPFTPHDLRRTAASHMSALGTSRTVLKKILNHTDNNVTAIYDRHTYEKEKKQALDAWGLTLESIILNTPNTTVVNLDTWKENNA